MAELDKYTQKAIEDPHFRSKVLKDANKAIKEEFGYEPPYKITYHVSDKNHIVFTLPPEDGSIDDNVLANIAGGQALIKGPSKKPNAVCGYLCYDPSARFF